jgi:hypothetical protein
MNNKYEIVIDGNASAWLRPLLFLYGKVVPIVIESRFEPLYIRNWVPWIHYVPVKNDQSDLVEKIDWLKANDDKAKIIAQNGRPLYKRLYTL